MENNSLIDLIIWGECIDKIDKDGNITNIPFGSKEYEDIINMKHCYINGKRVESKNKGRIIPSNYGK